ncbi:HEAT repeat-containing protein 6, partial [Nowakowskiella sp. JEL0078]
CRSNGARAIGNMVKICPVGLLQPELVDGIALVMIKIVASGSDKARWNACHAVGNMILNRSFPIGTAAWTDSYFESLNSAIKKCKNFKVRIQASAALTSISSLEQLGSFETPKLTASNMTGMSQCATNIKRVMESIIGAIDGVDDLAETQFSEVKYKEQLSDQLKKTFRHFHSLIQNTRVGDELSWYLSSIPISKYI